MSDQPSPQGWAAQPLVPPPPPVAPGTAGAHPLLWTRMPPELPSPPIPRSPEEALAMMERSHAATIALLPDDGGDSDETMPLTRAWFDGVREACARTGRVPGVERLLFEWWINEPPIDGLTQLPWLFGVWQGHWICWAGTTPWAAADLAAKSAYDEARVTTGVQFGADPENPPATPWPPFGTSALAVPTTILLALSGKPAPAHRLIPATPLFVPPPAPEPPPPPPPPPVPVATPEPEVAVLPDAAPEAFAPDTAPAAGAGAEVAPDTALTAEPEGAPGADASTEPETFAPETAPEPEPEAEAAPEAEAETGDAAFAPDAASAAEVAPATAAWGQDEALVPSPAAEVAPVAPIEPPAPPPQPQNLPPAGWHPDPSGRHALRYWDGSQWTAHAADPGSDTIHDPI